MSLSPQGFDRICRLTTASEYKQVFAAPERSSDAFFTVLGKVTQEERPRLGLAVAKKHLKRAVDRNRIKRLVRESFRLHRAELAPIDFVVLVKSGIQQSNNQQLRNSLMKHWLKIQQKCEKS